MCIKPNCLVFLGVGGRDEKYISIYLNGENVARSQADGTFKLQIPSDITRLTLLLKDDIYKQYMDTLSVVIVPAESSGNVHITIRMVKRGAEVKVMANEESEVAVTSPDSGKTIAEVLIPADSVYTPDGEPYTVRIFNFYFQLI